MKTLTPAELLEVMNSLRALSFQVEQKNYMILEQDRKIDHIAEGVQKFHELQQHYSAQNNELDERISEMKSLMDFES